MKGRTNTENLVCKNHKYKTANELERLASRIEVRGTTSPPVSEKRRTLIKKST